MKANYKNWPEFFEQYQISFFSLAILIGFISACFFSITSVAEMSMNAILPILLFVTFLQVPFNSVIIGFKSRRFMVALLVGNFVFVPIFVFLMSKFGIYIFKHFVGFSEIRDTSCSCGLFLTFTTVGTILLCAPCVDYVVSFCRVANGDTARLTAALPALLLIQCVFFVYWLDNVILVEPASTGGYQKLFEFIVTFSTILILPLGLAWLLQWISRYNKQVARSTKTIKNTVVIVAALTLLITSAYAFSEILSTFQIHYFNDGLDGIVQQQTEINDGAYTDPNGWTKLVYHHVIQQSKQAEPFISLLYVLFLYLLYACFAPFIGIFTAKLFKLKQKQAVAVGFSVSTRNSLVLLPLLLAIFAESEKALIVAAVLTQTCVELIAEIFYVRFIPSFVKKIGIRK